MEWLPLVNIPATHVLGSKVEALCSILATSHHPYIIDYVLVSVMLGEAELQLVQEAGRTAAKTFTYIGLCPEILAILLQVLRSQTTKLSFRACADTNLALGACATARRER